MKRYKLLKDLPTFRAGDEFELREDECLWRPERTDDPSLWEPEVMAYHKSTLAYFPNILEEWFEEIKEPKERTLKNGTEYFRIDSVGDILQSQWDGHPVDCGRYAMGNVFRTREEAKKAMEKLKAWKRLKDKGFKLSRWHFPEPHMPGKIIIEGNLVSGIVDDIDLVFGGDE